MNTPTHNNKTNPPTQKNERPLDNEEVNRIEKVLKTTQCHSYEFREVSNDFYEQSLLDRVKCLNAKCEENLCKTLLMKNTQCKRKDLNDRFNSEFYYVVFPYSKKLHPTKLKNAIKDLKKR